MATRKPIELKRRRFHRKRDDWTGYQKLHKVMIEEGWLEVTNVNDPDDPDGRIIEFEKRA